MGQQTVDPRHADVIVSHHSLIHDFGSDAGFLRHRQVRRTGRHHGNRTRTLLGFNLTQCDAAGQFVVFSLGKYSANRFVGLLIRAGGQHIDAGIGALLENRSNLVGGLAFTVNYFREATAQGAMMVDLGKRQVLEGHVFEVVQAFVHAQRAGFDLLQKLSQRVLVHREKISSLVSAEWASSSS